MTLPNSTRLTRPLTISPMRSLNSSNWRSRSASRTFCTITCLAVCAAMRPKSIGGSASIRKSPTLRLGIAALRPRRARSGSTSFSTGSATSRIARQPDLAGLAVDLGADVVLMAVFGAAGLLDRLLHGLQHLVAVDALLARDRVGDLQQFEAGVRSDCVSILVLWSVRRSASAGGRGEQLVGQDQLGLADLGERQRGPRRLELDHAARSPRQPSELAAKAPCGPRPAGAVSSLASKPAKRSKSAGRISGRSMPGELTSSV